MKLYFDKEFTGLRKDTTVISLGIVDENNRSIYAEFTDYDKSQIDPWLKKNIIDKTLYLSKKEQIPDEIYIEDGNETTIVSTKLGNRKRLLEWISFYGDEEIQFVSDVSHYDMVLLIDVLFDSALKMPNNISAACHDINHDIARYKKVSIKEAFDLCREDLLTSKELSKIKGDKHNSLYDAKVIKAIYEKINK